LPKESEVKNFQLNSVKRTETGFEIKVNWGGGVYHYELQFNFRCKENSFYLYKVKKESFSTTNPDSGNFLDKKETKETKIEPNLPIEKSVMTDYLQSPKARRRPTTLGPERRERVSQDAFVNHSWRCRAAASTLTLGGRSG
jgi:hypothetical protein